MGTKNQDTLGGSFSSQFRRPGDIIQAFRAADSDVPCICVGAIALIATGHQAAGRRSVAAELRRARPPVPDELALALGKPRPALYSDRLQAALHAALTTARPLAVLAALRGRSEEGAKQHRYIRKTIRTPVVRFRPVQFGHRRLIVRE